MSIERYVRFGPLSVITGYEKRNQKLFRLQKFQENLVSLANDAMQALKKIDTSSEYTEAGKTSRKTATAKKALQQIETLKADLLPPAQEMRNELKATLATASPHSNAEVAAIETAFRAVMYEREIRERFREMSHPELMIEIQRAVASEDIPALRVLFDAPPSLSLLPEREDRHTIEARKSYRALLNPTAAAELDETERLLGLVEFDLDEVVSGLMEEGHISVPIEERAVFNVPDGKGGTKTVSAKEKMESESANLAKE